MAQRGVKGIIKIQTFATNTIQKSTSGTIESGPEALYPHTLSWLRFKN